MLISIVIPTFEEPKLHHTLNELMKQTVFKKYPKQVEIVIADQDINNNDITFNSFQIFMKRWSSNHNIKFFKLFRKGIAFGRHHGILNSSGKVIVNFDADARFSTEDGIEKLVDPILRGEVTITCCDNILDTIVTGDLETEFILHGFTLLNEIQRNHLIVCLEPGMTFTRYAYDFVGGFNIEIKQAEAMILSPKIIYNFGLFCKRHIADTNVITSSRRINAIGNVGLLTALNYDNSFRI